MTKLNDIRKVGEEIRIFAGKYEDIDYTSLSQEEIEKLAKEMIAEASVINKHLGEIISF